MNIVVDNIVRWMLENGFKNLKNKYSKWMFISDNQLVYLKKDSLTILLRSDSIDKIDFEVLAPESLEDLLFDKSFRVAYKNPQLFHYLRRDDEKDLC